MSVMPAYQDAHATLAAGGAFTADTPWRAARRADALEALATLGFPTRKDEEWKYTPLRALQKAAFAGAAERGPFDADAHRLSGDGPIAVFVDGVFAPEASALPTASGVVAMPMSAALDAHGGDVEAIWAAEGADFASGFSALNEAFARDGVALFVAPDTSAERLQILHISTGAAARGLAALQHTIRVGAGSRARIVETFVGAAGAEYLTNRGLRADVARGARLDHTVLQRESTASHHVSEGFVQLAADAEYHSNVVSFGGKVARDTLTVRLHESGGHAALGALYVPGDGQTIDNHTAIDHRAQGCTSDQLYKGILDGSGHGVFNGKIFVRQPAQQTAAEQMNRNLVLSPNARIDTKPQLEIFADDVRCTHGCTIGQLERDELFYLMSRAISRTRARQMLLEGFAREVFERSEDALVEDTLLDAFRFQMALAEGGSHEAPSA